MKRSKIRAPNQTANSGPAISGLSVQPTSGVIDSTPPSNSGVIAARPVHDVVASVPEDLPEASVKAILDVAAKEFSDEKERFKHLDTKSGLLLASTGVSVTVAVNMLAKGFDLEKAGSMTKNALQWLALGVGISLFFLLIALCMFVLVLYPRKFRQFDLKEWIDYRVMRHPLPKIYATIAGTSIELVENLAIANKRKAQLFWCGLVALGIGAVALIAAVCWAFVVPVLAHF